ncbi:ABC transporter ATP-binding protein [Roseovarius sp. D22-M7]|uniref:ABC transporter ATP-binding protein n=1 Tax=Roseovarius sp. D22-M7 TaxID=3127116 RepID=UPI0030100039
MIEVAIDAKSFGDVQVLGKVHFTLAAGETLAILGPSGVGKSTLLRIVAGIDIAYQGHVRVPARRAMVFQDPTLLPWRSALDNLRIVHPDLGDWAARATLAKVGLGDRAGAFPGQLSLGQQRRLSLARAFAGRPELLVMDEPFVSLDAATADEMLGLTEALIAETRPATVFVTHSPVEAARLADRVLHLDGAPASLRAAPACDRPASGAGSRANGGRDGRT